MPDVISGQGAQAAADPVAMISALLDAEKVTPNTPKEPQAQKPAEPAQPEADAEYQPGENAQAEGEDAPQSEGEKSPVAEIPLDQLDAIELEVKEWAKDGKRTEAKRTIKELREGYMRLDDYSRNIQDVARQREEVGKQVRQGIESERSTYLTNLQQLQTALVESVAPELKNADWNSLATNDPFKYVELRNRAEQITNTLSAIKAKQQEIIDKQGAERRETVQAEARKTWATLESDIPGWNAETYREILKASESLGYTQTETGEWIDPRAVKLLHKAYLYDQLKAGKPSPDKKVVVAPPAIKPGATSSASRPAQQKAQALDRLRKSGRLDDLAAILAQQM